MKKVLSLAILLLTLLCSTEVQAQGYSQELDNYDCYSDNVRCSWCGELMTPEEYAYHDCDDRTSVNDDDYFFFSGGSSSGSVHAHDDGDVVDSGGGSPSGNTGSGETVSKDEALGDVTIWGNYKGFNSLLELLYYLMTGGYGTGNSNSNPSLDEEGSSNNQGVYDDVEDNSQFKWTLEDILKNVMARNDSFRKIVEKLQKEGRIKQDSPDDNCHYYPEDHCLHVPADGNFSVDNIIHEIIHYIQEENGMLNYDLCSADNEYQAYVLNYIINRAYGDIISAPAGTRDCQEWRDFVDLIPQGISVNDGECTYTEDFIDALQSLNHGALSQSFRSHWEWQKKENYYKNHDPNYKYNWEKMFNDFGFKKKE